MASQFNAARWLSLSQVHAPTYCTDEGKPALHTGVAGTTTLTSCRQSRSSLTIGRAYSRLWRREHISRERGAPARHLEGFQHDGPLGACCRRVGPGISPFMCCSRFGGVWPLRCPRHFPLFECSLPAHDANRANLRGQPGAIRGCPGPCSAGASRWILGPLLV